MFLSVQEVKKNLKFSMKFARDIWHEVTRILFRICITLHNLKKIEEDIVRLYHEPSIQWFLSKRFTMFLNFSLSLCS